MKPTIWKNCYSEQWAGILIPPAFAHPAKISLALVKRIFSHAIELGWIKKGDTCVDPFAGVGGVAFGAIINGINFIGQELEPHFVELANGMDCTGISKADWVRFYGRWEKVNRRDGRNWCPNCLTQAKQIVNPIAKTKDLFDLLGTASYERNSGKIPSTLTHRFEGNIEFWQRKFGLTGAVILQGDSRKLLENLREKFDAILCDPPYKSDGLGHRESPSEIDIKKKLYARIGNSQYGNSDANLGNLPAGNFDTVISSPPYINSISGNGHGIDFSKIKDGGTNRTAAREAIGTGYGESPAQLGSMPEGCFDIAVSSPPYEGIEQSGGIRGLKKHGTGLTQGKRSFTEYGNTLGQLGRIEGETFWTASREIVQQCFLALKPGGHAIWVTKRFVREGEIVEFSQQWARLCESVGFKVVCWHHAMLVEEGAAQIHLDGGETKEVRERKSFFRRLAEKNGSPRIDWEDVICMVKPARTFERLFIDGRNGEAKLKTETVEIGNIGKSKE